MPDIIKIQVKDYDIPTRADLHAIIKKNRCINITFSRSISMCSRSGNYTLKNNPK